MNTVLNKQSSWWWFWRHIRLTKFRQCGAEICSWLLAWTNTPCEDDWRRHWRSSGTQWLVLWSLPPSLTHPHSLTHPPTHRLTDSPTDSLTDSPTDSPTDSLTHPLTHWMTDWLTHPPTHSLTQSPIRILVSNGSIATQWVRPITDMTPHERCYSGGPHTPQARKIV